VDLDSIPFPDREGIDIHYVASLPLDVPAVIWDRPYTSIVSSRGCPFACSYCNCPTFSGRRCRVRSSANVLKELEEIKRQGYSAFSFIDDNFLLNPERVTKICEGMVARGHSFRWACEGRADPKVYGVFRKLSAAGCDVVMFGIESGSQRVLDGMNKGTTLFEIEQSVAHAKKARIGIRHGFFIVGSPGETVEEVKETFAFAERIGINSFNFNSLTVFRGTPLWRDAVTRGLIDEEKDWYKMFPVHSIYPDAIDSKTLFRLRSGLVRRLIRRKSIRNPREAARVFLRFLKCLSIRDLYRLLTSSTKDHTRTRL
jgi:anaerobic magnesium-protoporphyrin IX monomethyl ester cyclase